MKLRSASSCGLFLSSFILGIGLSLVPTSGFPQNAPTLFITPSSLRISGVQGSCQQRTLLVRSTQPLEAIQIVMLDLANEDGTQILPVANIKSCPQNKNALNQGTDEALPVNLQKIAIALQLSNTQSGTFSGELLLIHAGSEENIPITVQIKDRPILPLVTIVLGLVFSTTVSAYSVGGKIHDEITVEIEKLKANMDVENLFPRGFRNGITQHLNRVEAERDAQQWRKARQELDSAKAIWMKWVTEKSEWLTLVDKAKKLARDSESRPETAQIKSHLRNILNKLSSYQNPTELENKLQQLIQDFGLEPQAKSLQSPKDSENLQEEKGKKKATSLDVLKPILNVLSYLKPDADGRLRMFYFGSYIILLATLTGSGFRELYLNRPGFGSDPWRDYFSLLAWGFGAEAARSSVTKVIRNKEMPDVLTHPPQQQEPADPSEQPIEAFSPTSLTQGFDTIETTRKQQINPLDHHTSQKGSPQPEFTQPKKPLGS